MRVWVVDDQASFRRATAATLAAMDDFVMAGECETGESAVERIHDGDADIVLMDIHMPGMGGIEATRRDPRCAPGFDRCADVDLRRRGPSRCRRRLRRRRVPAQGTPVSRIAEPDMADSAAEVTTAADSVPHWRVPRELLCRGGSVFGFVGPRLDQPIPGASASSCSSPVISPCGPVPASCYHCLEYIWILRSAWVLALAAVCTAHCVALAVALRLAAARQIRAIGHVGMYRDLDQHVAGYVCITAADAGDGAGGAGARRLRRALYPLAARACLRRDHRGFRAVDGCPGALHADCRRGPCRLPVGSRPRSSSWLCRSTLFISW